MATQKKYDIFISYSRKNLDEVKAIKMEIEKSTGAECWMDLEGIESGSTQFTQDIVDGINDCRVFLFMLSEYSQASEFALRELNFVMKKAKTDKLKHVIIVNIDDCKMSDEFEFMYGLTDTIAWLNQPQREKFLRDLKRWLYPEKEDPSNPVYQRRQKNEKERLLREKYGADNVCIVWDNPDYYRVTRRDENNHPQESIVDEDGKLILNWGTYDRISQEVFFNTKIPWVEVMKDAGDKWLFGLFHRDQGEVLPCEYDEIKLLSDSVFVRKEDTEWTIPASKILNE